ncbi:hypothetical protein [Candidatus Mycoplasma haematohominis]|uniref:Uncharacterized protein n=1 Tax=Candidatus Mycoplasma haematohominis TaxID=1494318 RepID=A0A478FRE0_9MOLU|nr:hypothetical protein [Candidatus Mycoplasma haemohominis]GCE63737.1 hypothetical protein MHSWG343_07370 [Candidatus Mycoplasma haemohominis]
MASPAAIGAGIGGGAVAVAGTSYAAYTQLRPYDDFSDYARRNWFSFIYETDEKIKEKIRNGGDGTAEGYRKYLKDELESIKGTGDGMLTDEDVTNAGKDNDTGGAKLTKVVEKVKAWCTTEEKKKPQGENGKVDWSKIEADVNWKKYEKLCLEPPKK